MASPPDAVDGISGAIEGKSVKVHSVDKVAATLLPAVYLVYLLRRTPADVMASFGWANALTALRLLLIGPAVWAIHAANFGLAAGVFTLAVVTDLADGPIARARNEVSAIGGVFDHSVDALFVAAGLLALALFAELLVVPWVLPLLVLASFSQYALDSRILAGKALRASALGRYNGIGYYALLGTAVIGAVVFPAVGLPLELLATLLAVLGWTLVITTLLSMLDRLVAYRKARGSP